MREQPWFPFFWRDWAMSTRTMSAAAKGCYIDLLAHAWGAGGVPVNSDERRRITGVDRAEWRRVWPQLEARWMERGGVLVNRRQEEVRERQALASRAGRASAEARAAANGTAQPPSPRSNGNPNGPRTEHGTGAEHAAEPIRVQSTEKKQTPLTPKGEYTPEFDRFWQAYPTGTDPRNPRRTGKATAFKAWRRISPDAALVDAMLSALQWQAATTGWTKEGGQYIPLPSTWLNARRWEDERPGSAGSLLEADDEPEDPRYDLSQPYAPKTREIPGW